MLPRPRTGDRRVAEGILAAGSRFFAAYPITPSSEIHAFMMGELRAKNLNKSYQQDGAKR